MKLRLLHSPLLAALILLAACSPERSEKAAPSAPANETAQKSVPQAEPAKPPATPANADAIPADPGPGMKWEQLPVSDEFNKDVPAEGKPESFTSKWKEGFINQWKGPGLTEWTANHSMVRDGNLEIRASRKPGTNKVLTGCISSHEAFTYPLYMETRVRLSRQVLASCVWLLSGDSTEEIDLVEAYGSDRPDQKWTAERLHLSHHVFIREPFQDYQPTDKESWYRDGTLWADEFHRVEVYWKDPWNLDYYVDGKLVRSVSGKDVIDPKNFTGGKGLTKPMHVVINMEDQTWRSDKGTTPTDEELADSSRNTMLVDWIRVYKPVAK